MRNIETLAASGRKCLVPSANPPASTRLPSTRTGSLDHQCPFSTPIHLVQSRSIQIVAGRSLPHLRKRNREPTNYGPSLAPPLSATSFFAFAYSNFWGLVEGLELEQRVAYRPILLPQRNDSLFDEAFDAASKLPVSQVGLDFDCLGRPSKEWTGSAFRVLRRPQPPPSWCMTLREISDVWEFEVRMLLQEVHPRLEKLAPSAQPSALLVVGRFPACGTLKPLPDRVCKLRPGSTRVSVNLLFHRFRVTNDAKMPFSPCHGNCRFPCVSKMMAPRFIETVIGRLTV